MKTYLKRSYDKSSTFYSSLDVPTPFSSRDNVRQRIVQPSTKEQQRLLSATSSSRLQHVHWGKYGIKPLWSSDKSSCEQWQQAGKSLKHPWSSFLSRTSKIDREHCSNYRSDLQKKTLLSSTSPISLIDQRIGSIGILATISLLLLLLVYFAYRRQRTKYNQIQLHEQRRRQSLEHDLLYPHSFDDRISTVRALPTIIEETPVLTTAALDNDKLPSTSLDRCPTIPTITVPQDEQPPVPASIRRRRSRFDHDSAVDSTPIETNVCPPVVVRKLSTAHQHVISDDFKSLEEINNAVKQVGLVHSQLIFGIDYTISNLETGKHSFQGRSLHHIQDGVLNPYQSVITIVGRTLEKYDSDSLIPVFGFGDRSTLDRKIFPLRPDGSSCKGFRGVLEAYNEITPKVRMSGPTNFAPLIREAVRLVKKTRQYHILVIVADGQVTNENQTKDAIVEASNYPLSIVMIGVGDGPWDMMNEFDDSLPTRLFDNFQFVDYNSIVKVSNNDDSAFALRALMEIPSQYAAIKELGLLQKS